MTKQATPDMIERVARAIGAANGCSDFWPYVPHARAAMAVVRELSDGEATLMALRLYGYANNSLNAYDPDEYETIVTHSTCAFHKMHPGEQFAGCCCSAGMMQKLRDPEEYAAIKAKKRRAEEDRILAQAEAIRASRHLLTGDKD